VTPGLGRSPNRALPPLKAGGADSIPVTRSHAWAQVSQAGL
jgi:hypothetical protein